MKYWSNQLERGRGWKPWLVMYLKDEVVFFENSSTLEEKDNKKKTFTRMNLTLPTLSFWILLARPAECLIEIANIYFYTYWRLGIFTRGAQNFAWLLGFKVAFRKSKFWSEKSSSNISQTTDEVQMLLEREDSMFGV